MNKNKKRSLTKKKNNVGQISTLTANKFSCEYLSHFLGTSLIYSFRFLKNEA